MTRAVVALGILARAPVPGRCKTRLIPALGAEGAAAVQSELIEHSLRLAHASQLPTWLFTTDDPDQPYWTRQAPDLPRRPQVDGDLGARMAAALAELLRVAERALIIGTDCPLLTPPHLQAAAQLLDEADAVVLPAEDGGYVLIGARQTVPDLFEGVEWGTATVLAHTRQKAQQLGIRLAVGPTLWDVDRPEDHVRALAEGCLTTARS